MKKSNAIRRAAERLDNPALSYAFNARLMARVRKREREQRRSNIITGIAASVAVIAMVAYGASAIAQVEFPKIDWSAIFDGMIMPQIRLWGAVTLSVVAMLVADMYIRQYLRRRRLKE